MLSGEVLLTHPRNEEGTCPAVNIWEKNIPKIFLSCAITHTCSCMIHSLSFRKRGFSSLHSLYSFANSKDFSVSAVSQMGLTSQETMLSEIGFCPLTTFLWLVLDCCVMRPVLFKSCLAVMGYQKDQKHWHSLIKHTFH